MLQCCVVMVLFLLQEWALASECLVSTCTRCTSSSIASCCRSHGCWLEIKQMCVVVEVGSIPSFCFWSMLEKA